MMTSLHLNFKDMGSSFIKLYSAEPKAFIRKKQVPPVTTPAPLPDSQSSQPENQAQVESEAEPSTS